MRILLTSKQPECDLSDECATPCPYSLVKGTFDTERPCAARRVACLKSQLGAGKPLTLGEQVVEADMWGMDCYSRRNVQSVLEVVIGLTGEDAKRLFIQQLLLPVVDCQPSFRAHDITFALRSILSNIGPPPLPEDYVAGKHAFPHVFGEWQSDYSPDEQSSQFTRDAVGKIVAHIQNIPLESCFGQALSTDTLRLSCAAILYAARNWGLDCFRIHPKGVGVQCRSEEGLPSGTFVTEYLGELFPPWRWFERTDAIKNVQRAVGFKPVLPDFYNIAVERHQDDQAGYDLAYIDPIVRGNFASRLSHSCEPNCATVVMIKNGKYVVTVYTLRDIAFGEELCFDYSSVTEDENEFRAATCLCGSLKCRGSFLYYAGLGAFADVVAETHQFLDRHAMIVEACANPILSQADEERLVRHGLKKAALEGLPLWLRKWSSLALRYAEF